MSEKLDPKGLDAAQMAFQETYERGVGEEEIAVVISAYLAATAAEDVAEVVERLKRERDHSIRLTERALASADRLLARITQLEGERDRQYDENVSLIARLAEADRLLTATLFGHDVGFDLKDYLHRYDVREDEDAPDHPCVAAHSEGADP